MATDEELLVMFSQPGTTRREALRAVYNAGLSRAAEITRTHAVCNHPAKCDSCIDLLDAVKAIEAERDQA